MTSTAHTADRLARGVAYVINPLLLPPLLFGSILALFDAPPAEIGVVGAVCLTFLTAVPVVVIRRMIETGRTESIDVLDRRARIRPYLAGLLGTLGALAGLAAIVDTARTLVLAVSLLLFVNTALLAVVNLRWKISLHAAGASGFVTILLFASYLASPGSLSLVPAVGAVPIVMWARVRTRAHTPGEVWAGAAFGVAAPLFELSALVATGHL